MLQGLRWLGYTPETEPASVPKNGLDSGIETVALT